MSREGAETWEKSEQGLKNEEINLLKRKTASTRPP